MGKLKRILSFTTACLLFLSVFSFYSPEKLKSEAAGLYWDNSDTAPLTFGALPKTYPGSAYNVVTFKTFVSENGTGASFSLLSKYTDGLGSFDPAAFIIMIEDASDLRSWSEKALFQNPGASNPVLERSVYLSARFVLGNNIDYTGTVGMIPIGFWGTNAPTLRFTGSFDGQGFEISNLTLTLDTTHFKDENNQQCIYYGMFSQIGASGTVKNLGLRAPQYTEGNGVFLNLNFGGIAGYNRGTLEYCFVVSGSARFSSVDDAGQIAGVLHTNEGVLDNTYFAGGIFNVSNRTGTTYNPVVFLNTVSGTVSNAYYDSDLFDATINTVYASVVARTTTLLQSRTSILQNDRWYTDNYTRHVTNYLVGYPRLQGFKVNNAINNSTTNPYYIARPADLIFFSNALNAYATFGNIRDRFFRLRNCIDMSTVSAAAYTTPVNDFGANFEGTIDNGSEPCVANHVGTGEQLNCHCIINLRITKPTIRTISSTTYLLMGLVANNSSSTNLNISYFRNLNFVGGSITLPSLSAAEAYNTNCNIGMAVAYAASYVFLSNVHTSADISLSNADDFICKLRMGGLAGGIANSLNATKCSNNGTVNAGMRRYNSSVTTNTSFVGGLFGSQESTGGTKQMTECVNYGEVTGLSTLLPAQNPPTTSVAACYVGGISGFVNTTNYILDRAINYGTVNSVKKLPVGASIFPINQYFAGGLFGYGPAGPVTAGSTDTRLCNKGTIYANRTDQPAAGSAVVAGISGTTGNSSNNYKNVANAGNIIIAKDIRGIYAAGITNGAISLIACYNDGEFLVEDNAPLSNSYEIRIFGISGGSSSSTAFNLTGCYNNKDINLSFSGATATMRIAGISYNMKITDSENYGDIAVTASTSSGQLFVSGASDTSIAAAAVTNSGNISINITNLTGTSSYIGGVLGGNTFVTSSNILADNLLNSGNITVNSLDQSTNLFVGGVVCSNGRSSTVSNSKNTGAIYVSRSTRNNTTAKTTLIAGVNVGNNTTSDIVTDCQNDGEIGYDYYCTPDAPSGALAATSTAFIAGIQIYALSVNRCVNYGNIVLAKNYDYTGTTLAVSGVIYNGYSNNETNVIQNCRNFGNISNVNNIGTTTNASTRNIYASGIIYLGSPNMSRCVNQGNISLTSWNSANNTNYYVNGVAHNTGNIESNRLTFGITGLANVGNLTVNHSQSAFPANSRVYISGVLYNPGTGLTSTVGTLPVSNLVNIGKIDVNVRTSSAISYVTPTDTSNGITSFSHNVAVGGISVAPGFNVNNANTTEIPIRDSANAGDIFVDLICGSSTPSATINYAVGGIAATTASNTAGSANLKSNLYNCVNGGNITVNTLNSSSSSNFSGVGGILGLAYQFTNITTVTESNANSGVFNCINFGNITGGYSTGGIVGCDASVIKNVMNFGTVYGTNNGSAGGIVGAIRAGKKTNATRQLFAIDGAINYGSVAEVSGQTPSFVGGILGYLGIGQDTTYGTRRYEKIINCSSVKFVGGMVTQGTLNTFGAGTLIDLVTVPSTPPAWETSNSFFKNNLIYKTGGPVTESTSIYYKDLGNDANSFFWRVGEDLPENNNWFVYKEPFQSSRNTYDEGTETYVPFVNGIYALSTFEGKKSGFYPSSNVILQNCDPLISAGVGYTNWRTDIIGINTESAVEMMRHFRQIKLNTGNDIISLQLTDGTTSLRNAEVDQANSKVIFYVVKDNFTAGTYSPDLYSTNTVLSDKASFEGSTSMDMTAGFTFLAPEVYSFPVIVAAEDGNTKNWTVELRSVPVTNALTLTQIREGVGIDNTSTTFNERAFTSTDAFNYSLTGSLPFTHNNTLILNFNTVGFLPGKNLINDVTIQTEAGVVVTPGVSSANIGSSNTTYFKVPPTGVYGLNSYNYKIISSDYEDYLGTLTVNLRLHSNLSSGNYKILINTVYGTYTYSFTRALSAEAEIQSTPSVLLISGGTATCSINSASALITNSTSISYGNAPDISRLATTGRVFSSVPVISKNAVMSNQRLISSTINASGSREYLFGFTITAENGTVKNWTLRVLTLAYNPTPAKIEVDFGGVTYIDTQVTVIENLDDYPFIMNKIQSGNFAVRYDVTAGNSGSNPLHNITNISYFTYELYWNGIFVPVSEFANYGITIVKQATVGNYLKVAIDALASATSGEYELRAYYYRPPVDITPVITDDGSNTYSQFAWTEIIPYPSFKFYKAEGKKFSYATGVTLPYVQDIFSITCGQDSIYWDGTNFDYTILGADVTSEANARYGRRTFNLSFGYKTDVFYYNFKPIFHLPEGATLWRETFIPNEFEPVTAENLAADFSGGKSIRYRVRAEDTRYYNDYVITLTQVVKSKQFQINYEFINGASNTLPVSATLKSLGIDSESNYAVLGNITSFSHPSETFPLDMLPAGTYIFDTVVPYGYRAFITASNSPTANDITVNGKLLSGNWKMRTSMDESIENFTITVYIEPIPSFSVPWGIRRQSRG